MKTTFDAGAAHLCGHVDWQYLLDDIWRIYRFSSAAGSRPIRSHQRQVRDQLRAEIEREPRLSFGVGEKLPVCAWLG